MSGNPSIGSKGEVKFGALDKTKLSKLSEKIKRYTKNADEASEVEINIAGSLSNIRTKWANLFSQIGGKLDKSELAEFKQLFGGKFKNYLGSTYDIFQNKSLLPWMSYTPTAEAVSKTKAVLIQSAKDAGRELSGQEADDAVARILKTTCWT